MLDDRSASDQDHNQDSGEDRINVCQSIQIEDTGMLMGKQ